MNVSNVSDIITSLIRFHCMLGGRLKFMCMCIRFVIMLLGQTKRFLHG